MSTDAPADPGFFVDDDDDESTEQYSEALLTGLKRARIHLVRAGIELVSGLGVVIEELKRVRDDEPSDAPERGPKRIELE